MTAGTITPRGNAAGCWRPLLDSLEPVPGARLAEERWLLARRQTWAFTLSGQALEMRFLGDGVPHQDCREIPLLVSGHPVMLWMDSRLWQQVLSAGGQDFDWSGIPEEFQPLALGQVLAPLIGQMERLSGHRVEFAEAGAVPEDGRVYGFSITQNDALLGALWVNPGLCLEEEFRRGVAGCFPEQEALDRALAVRLVPRLAGMRLTAGEAASIRRGDMVLLPPSSRADQELVLIAEGGPFIRCRMQDGQAQILDIGGDEMDLDQVPERRRDDLMESGAEDEPVKGGAAIGPPSFDPGQLPVHLTFDLGDVTLSVGELSGLSVGGILDINRSVTDLVTIRANGRLFGEGELMRLDDRLGVRLTKVNGHG